MPLQLPNLDDRRYADLVEEARSWIPTFAPEWTNHNPSDPGITLVELFAFLTEMLIYRLNRVTDENMLRFLKLLNGPDWSPAEPGNLTEEIRKTVLALRRPDRAITCADFESLALAADPRVARAHCLPRRNLAAENPLTYGEEKPGHVSLVIVPQSSSSNPQPSPDLIQKVKADLDPKRLLTTRLHVVGPSYVQVGVRLTLVLKRDALEDDVRAKAVAALNEFLHPLTGGPEGNGWPFGRNVYVSEIYELLDKQSGVDYVTKTKDPITSQPLDELVVADSARLLRNSSKELVAVEIRPEELVEAQIVPGDLTIKSPVEA
jgi:hypothetical protein